MFSKITEISSGKSLSGILIFNDDSRIMMQPGTPHSVILAENLRKVYIGAMQIPVVFFSKGKHIPNSISGFITRSAEEHLLVDTTSRAEYRVDLSCYSNQNKSLEKYAEKSGLHIFILNLNHLKIDLRKEANFRPGREAALIWIGTLAVSRFMLTRAFLKACIYPKRSYKDLERKIPMKGTRIENQWVMWYPSPTPRSLTEWIEFLSKGKGYEIENLFNLLPSLEGFYTFTLPRQNPDNRMRVVFDEEPMDTKGLEAYDVLKGSCRYLQITLPLNIDVPKSSSPPAASVFSGNEVVDCFVLPINPLILSGRLGPFRSTVHGSRTSSDWSSFMRKVKLDSRANEVDKNAADNFQEIISTIPMLIMRGIIGCGTGGHSGQRAVSATAAPSSNPSSAAASVLDESEPDGATDKNEDGSSKIRSENEEGSAGEDEDIEIVPEPPKPRSRKRKRAENTKVPVSKKKGGPGKAPPKTRVRSSKKTSSRKAVITERSVSSSGSPSTKTKNTASASKTPGRTGMKVPRSRKDSLKTKSSIKPHPSNHNRDDSSSDEYSESNESSKMDFGDELDEQLDEEMKKL